ncbi:hypothetical protein R3P38DRAFT_2543010, partial [Favolaschia claudopus]
DIIRCNSCFHNEPRYDSLLVKQTEPGLHIARARALLRCRLPSGRNVEIALVWMFGQSRWKPKTRWDGCEVREEEKEYSFLSMKYKTRLRFAPAAGHFAAIAKIPQINGIELEQLRRDTEYSRN